MDPRTFFEALDGSWVPLANAAAVFELIARLEADGVVRELRSPTAIGRICDLTGLSADTVGEALRTLSLYDVVEPSGDEFVLTPSWTALTDPSAFFPLSVMIAGQHAMNGVLHDLGRVTYDDQPSEDRVAMALSFTADPFSDELVAMHRKKMEADPVGRAMLAGGRFLELGCGVAGGILMNLRAAPRLTAVGVELSEDLAVEAARRAHELGVADRFMVVCGDATDYVATEPFDFGFWSQFFFPEPARQGALATMMAALRPGASFQAPLGFEPDLVRENRDLAREHALISTMLRSWGVPERTVESLTTEVEQAGFVDVEVVVRDQGPTVRSWKPA